MIVLRRIGLLGSLIACGAVALAIAAPMAQADTWGIDAQMVPLITEHSFGQDGPASKAVRCGQLDPWAYRLVCGGAGSHGSGTRNASPPASAVVRSTGFDWRDASIGAATTLGLLLLLGLAGTLALRRRRTVAHVPS